MLLLGAHNFHRRSPLIYSPSLTFQRENSPPNNLGFLQQVERNEAIELNNKNSISERWGFQTSVSGGIFGMLRGV